MVAQSAPFFHALAQSFPKVQVASWNCGQICCFQALNTSWMLREETPPEESFVWFLWVSLSLSKREGAHELGIEAILLAPGVGHGKLIVIKEAKHVAGSIDPSPSLPVPREVVNQHTKSPQISQWAYRTEVHF